MTIIPSIPVTPLKPVKSKIGLLFDVDGVIVRNKPLLQKVGKNCTQFINLVNRHKIYPRELEKYNKKLYSEYGHTLKGWMEDNVEYTKQIKKEYMIQLFNRYVYNDEILNDLETYIRSNEFKQIYEEINHAVSICKSNNIFIGLFSNAPETWCNIVANNINIPFENVYSSDHELLQQDMLYKPHIDAYMHVMQDIQNKDNKIQELIFIDDSLKNLTVIEQFPEKWNPIFFNPEKKNLVNSSKIQVVDSISDINNMIISKI